MMRFFTTGFILFQITVLSQSQKSSLHLRREFKKTDEKEILKTSESRYLSNPPDYPDRDFRDYNNRITRKDFDLPVTFKAPHYEAHDYWRNKQGYDNRRTFFDDYSYGVHDKTTAFPGFYQFMTSIFGGRGEVTPESPDRYHYPRNPVTPPYPIPHDPPFNFRPTEPNYIPPPKPIRASVIKLETITRSPIYPSFEYETTPKYYPHPGSLLNHVLIENSKAQHNFGFYPQEPKIPPFKPLPVLPKPGNPPPTTLKPIYPKLFNNQTQNLFKYYNETDYKYPESVQDQLPHFNLGEVKIPYVSEKPIPQIFNTLSTESSPQGHSAYAEDLFPPSNSRTTTNILGLIDIRSLNSPQGGADRRERPEFDRTTVKSFPGAVEKIKRPIFKYTKKITAQLDKNSVERVANLTVQGFSKSDKENFNFNNHFNHLNVKDLINFEMGRIKNISLSGLEFKQPTFNDSSTPPVNLNDELSLDAKILKDTNWDGLIVLPTASTADGPKETTTFSVLQTTESKPKRNNTAFWEIVDGQTTNSPTTSETTTEATTTTERSKIRTTTDFIPWPSTPQTTEVSELSTTGEETTRKISEEKYIEQSTTENTEMNDSTIPPERTTLTRRYSRRPKIVNFTPYPTAEEIQKKLINRNHFPKRQKPNITLAFGNKNVLKNRNNFAKDEVMKFSDEDVRRRRKIGKRRQVFKRVRVTTSERPVQIQ